MEIRESYSYEQTYAMGRELGEKLTPGAVVACMGELGAGKTAFTKGVAAALGIGEEITSPTFTLLCEYPGRIPLYHFDAYRIDAAGWLDAGFDEYLYGDGVCVIEWAENIRALLPDDAVFVSIGYDTQRDAHYRRIKIRGGGF